VDGFCGQVHGSLGQYIQCWMREDSLTPKRRSEIKQIAEASGETSKQVSQNT